MALTTDQLQWSKQTWRRHAHGRRFLDFLTKDSFATHDAKVIREAVHTAYEKDIRPESHTDAHTKDEHAEQAIQLFARLHPSVSWEDSVIEFVQAPRSVRVDIRELKENAHRPYLVPRNDSDDPDTAFWGNDIDCFMIQRPGAHEICRRYYFRQGDSKVSSRDVPLRPMYWEDSFAWGLTRERDPAKAVEDEERIHFVPYLHDNETVFLYVPRQPGIVHAFSMGAWSPTAIETV